MQSMRKIRLLLFPFLLQVVVAKTQPPLFLGTKTPYPPPTVSNTPPPEGFRPLFVNYVGRHGARYLTKAGADINTLRVLEKASSSQGLTEQGRKVRQIVGRLCDIDKGQYENITFSGAEEQRAIGNRVFDGYRSAFTGKGLAVKVTYKVRTRQSADAFLTAFAGYAGKVQFSKAADTLDAVLRYYDLSPGYQEYKKSQGLKRTLDSLKADPRTRAVADHVCSRLFVPAFRDSIGNDEALAFTEDLYDLYTASFALSGEMAARGFVRDSMDLGRAFSREDLVWEDFRSGAQDFLEKGPGRDALGIQVRVAAPLLVDFIRTMDEAAGGGGAAGGTERIGAASGPDAVLRFTHAEAISPFAALLGIPSASGSTRCIYDYADHWRAEAVIPLSANIQWILYSNGKDYYVKVLLNEREALLPMGKGQGPYYRWEELRAYCLQRLRQVGAGMGDDLLKYLKELR